MNTIITFLRHATAQDHALPIPDESRTLVDKGKEQVKRIATFCRKHELRPAYLFCSPLVRAQETAQTLHQKLPGCPTPNTVDWLTGTAPETMIAVLKKLAAGGLNDIWLVGHEPDFSEVISLLLGRKEPVVRVKKASLIRVEMDFQAGSGQLLWSIPNALLR